MKLIIRILFAAFVLSMVPTVSVEAQGKIESPLERKARLEREAAARKKKQQQEAAAQRRREEEARKKAEEEAAAREAEQQAREKAAREEAERERQAKEKAEREQAEREKKAKEQAEREEAKRKQEALRQLLNDEIFKNLVLVEGGTFQMGATRDQGSDAAKDENPVHQVSLSTFALCKYEVTQEVWEAVMGKNPSDFKGPKRPVNNVSQEDCLEFIKKLNQLTGAFFRLPTEAEWEFAARGGTKSKNYRYAGSNELDAVAWHSGNSNRTTHDVGTRQPNELGLYDMAGNVYEWCQDWYAPYTKADQTDPVVKREKGDSELSDFFVARGGGLVSGSKECRVAYRRTFNPDNGYNYLGLRLAVKVEVDPDYMEHAKLSDDGIPFPFENPTFRELDDWLEEYEDQMEEIIGKTVRIEELDMEMVEEMMDEDTHLAYLIVTSDYSKSKKEKWFEQYMEYQDGKREYKEMQELAIKLYKEHYEKLKKQAEQ